MHFVPLVLPFLAVSAASVAVLFSSYATWRQMLPGANTTSNRSDLCGELGPHRTLTSVAATRTSRARAP
jgi:hypothetical protein